MSSSSRPQSVRGLYSKTPEFIAILTHTQRRHPKNGYSSHRACRRQRVRRRAPLLLRRTSLRPSPRRTTMSLTWVFRAPSRYLPASSWLLRSACRSRSERLSSRSSTGHASGSSLPQARRPRRPLPRKINTNGAPRTIRCPTPMRPTSTSPTGSSRLQAHSCRRRRLPPTHQGIWMTVSPSCGEGAGSRLCVTVATVLADRTSH